MYILSVEKINLIVIDDLYHDRFVSKGHFNFNIRSAKWLMPLDLFRNILDNKLHFISINICIMKHKFD